MYSFHIQTLILSNNKQLLTHVHIYGCEMYISEETVKEIYE